MTRAPFVVLPALDISAGRADRVEGNPDPVATALAWQSTGAQWIHLVDLDAAYRRGDNAALLREVVAALDIDVELAGGITDDASLARALATGCTRVNLSTAATADPDWCARVIAEHGERIAVSLDVRVDSGDYRLVARGATSEHGDLWDALAFLDVCGCERYVVTDVSRDGMLTGPPLELCAAVAAATTARVVASGGVATLDDLTQLARLPLDGAIVGKALHADRFTLPEALEAVRVDP